MPTKKPVVVVDRGSVIATLRANRERLLKDTSVELKIPGWDHLYARYKRLPWEQVRDLSVMIDGDAQEQVGAAIDALLDACETLLYKSADGDLDLELRYEQTFAQEFLGDNDARTPAQVLMAAFIDEPAIMGQVGEYLVWAGREQDAMAEQLGKGSGRTRA